MTIQKLHDPKDGQMQVVGLMSGSGTNLRKIIEFERKLVAEYEESPYHLAVIFTNNPSSNAEMIVEEYRLPVVVRDMKGWYASKGQPITDLKARREFDEITVMALAEFNVSVAAYGGYMAIATQPLTEAFLGINVHPADLSIMEGNKRRYTGDNAVRDAILAGEKYIRSTTHIIEPKVDYGRILMISPPLEVRLGSNFNHNDKKLVSRVAGENQNRLKEAGDWIIFPMTLLFIAEGRYSQDAEGNLYFDGEPIPSGLKLEV